MANITIEIIKKVISATLRELQRSINVDVQYVCVVSIIYRNRL